MTCSLVAAPGAAWDGITPQQGPALPLGDEGWLEYHVRKMCGCLRPQVLSSCCAWSISTKHASGHHVIRSGWHGGVLRALQTATALARAGDRALHVIDIGLKNENICLA